MQLIHRVSCAAVSDCFFCFVQISELLSAPFGPSNFVFFPAFDKPHPVCPSGKAILCARLEPSPRRVCFARRGMYGEHGAREKISVICPDEHGRSSCPTLEKRKTSQDAPKARASTTGFVQSQKSDRDCGAWKAMDAASKLWKIAISNSSYNINYVL